MNPSSAFRQAAALAQFLRFDTPAPTSQVSSWPQPVTTWDDLAITAIALGLAPALHRRVQELDQAPVRNPAERPEAKAQAKLAVTYQAARQRNQAIARQLAELLQAYSSAGLEVIVLKGGYLAFAVYPEPALRGMSDLDLLFQPGDLRQGEAVLRSLGYQGKHTPAEQGPGILKHTSTYKREGTANPDTTPNPYLSAAGDRHVDPHGSLEESWFGLRVDVTPGIWERSRPVTLVNEPARAMAPEDLLLHLGVHLGFHLLMGKPSLVQLYDLAVVVDRFALDWESLIARCAQRDAIPFTFAALHLAQRVFGAAVPDAMLGELNSQCPPALAQHIAGLGLDDVMQQTQRPPLVSIRQRLRRGLSDRRETARWATTWSGKWAVWRTALQVGRTDTGRLLAQKLRGGDTNGSKP